MKNTSLIYEEVLLKNCFNKLKSIRDGWGYEANDKFGLSTIIDIYSDDYFNVESIMKCTESAIFEAIPEIIMYLFEEYKVNINWIQIFEKDAKLYSIGDDEEIFDYVDQGNENVCYAFSYENEQNEKILYIFKKFGIQNRFPKSIIKKIMQENHLTKCFHISFIEDEAYKEIINHNSNSDDATKGTGLYSLKQIFNMFFDCDEYDIFKSYTEKLAEKVKDYYGFQIVRTLTQNNLYSYRKVIEDTILKIDVSKLDVKNRISSDQKEILDRHFYNNYKLLIGNSVFAQSFMTAEWLYWSLQNVCNVDLTSIAMGYFKAIEQFLYYFISLHTLEKDSVERRIYTGSGRERLTDNLLSDERKVKNINLNALTRFFGDFKKGRCYVKNKDLLASGISDETSHFILETLSDIPRLRNGYFHKHNLCNWNEVENSRNCTLLVFYLLLGGYNFSESNLKELSVVQTETDGFYQLCEYINNKFNKFPDFNIPIYYFKEECGKYDFYFAEKDDYIEYSTTGVPKYSGVYFRRADKVKYKFTKSNIPYEIWEGTFSMCKDGKLNIIPSGPKKMIYKNGDFLL